MIVLAVIQLVSEGCVHLPSLQLVTGSSFFSTAMRAMAHLVRWFTYLKYHMAVVIINLYICRWIGLGENLQEHPIFNGKNHGFL